MAVLVEITARFDEAPNIAWGRYLENEGVHVAYGVEALKTHVKLALVVREEEGKIRRYAHIGTGNYHTGTARRPSSDSPASNEVRPGRQPIHARAAEVSVGVGSGHAHRNPRQDLVLG